MAEQDAALSDAQISLILQLLDEGEFDCLTLEMGDFKLSVSRSGQQLPDDARSAGEPAAPAPRPEPTRPRASSAQEHPADQDATAEPGSPQAGGSTHAAGASPVVAPTVGIFYRKPEPGAKPFVDVGTRFDEGSTLGLIEVMKTYIAVKAELPGVVLEVLAEEGAFVEYGQPLFLVGPEPGS